MKNRISIILLLCLILGTSKVMAQELTKKEEILADSLSFDHEILKSARLHTKVAFRGIPNNNLHEYPALVLKLETTMASVFVEKLGSIKHQFINKGYIFFKGARSDDGETEEVYIIKYNDPLYPIKYMKTRGSFPKLSTEQIFDKIERWHGRRGCTVIGAGANWVEVIFVLPLENTDELAKEMINFCPALEFVYRDAERLSAKLKENKPRVLLEW